MAAKKKASKSSAAKKRGRRKTAGAAGSKSAFVLSLPSDTSAKDVVAKAKEKGIEISEAHVYTIRSTAKRGPGKPKGRPAKKAGRGRARASNGAAPSKAEFVRSLPPGTSYAEASEKAKAVGINLSKAYYYVLKSEQKKKGGTTGRARKGRASVRRGGRQNSTTLTALPNGLVLTSHDPHVKAVLEAVGALGAESVRNVISTAERLLNA
jgi:post-segregation antitoxin (ccd killing protein)